MKTVAFITPTLGGGGAERTTIQLANGCAERGLKVFLLVTSLSGQKGKLIAEVAANVELVDLKCDRVSKLIIPLMQWIRQFRPDTLISTQTHTNIAVYLASLLANAGNRIICREVSTPSVNLKNLQGIKKKLVIFLMRWTYTHVDTVVAVSQGVADDLQQYIGTVLPNIRVIYNPVINPQLYTKASAPLAHKWFQENRNRPVILAVGRLTEAKNYPLLINAFAELIKDIPANLIILGEGEDRLQLEKLIAQHRLQDSIELHGFDENPYRYMARCDVYVMSSNWEGLPGALIQALALGAKVVSTDCPSGPREILGDNDYGFLVPTNDIAQLKGKISDQLNNKTIFKKNQQAIFELGKIITSYLEVI